MPAQTTSASASTPSVRRIMIELKGLEANPLPGVKVHVHDKDVTSLCLHLEPQEGIYRGLPLHLSVKLREYPASSPHVVLQTPMTHPNVFPGWEQNGAYICCDILKGRLVTDSKGRVSGYSPAYSLGTIFLQLMSFFSAKNIEQDGEYVSQNIAGEGARRECIRNIRKFNCKKCGYLGKDVALGERYDYVEAEVPSGFTLFDFVALELDDSAYEAAVSPKAATSIMVPAAAQPIPTNEAKVVTDADKILDLVGNFSTLPIELALEIASHMSVEDLYKLSRVSTTFGDLVQQFNLTVRRDQKCFYYKTGIQDATLGVYLLAYRPFVFTNFCLPQLPGVGIWVAEKGRNRDMKPVDFDLLSHEAFITENVRKTVWGQGFTHFLPLALTQQHFGKALPLLKTVLVELNLTTKSKEFRPETALHVISKLMNLMVVDLMKACDADSTFTQPVKMYETPKPI
ncbi:UNVERIFIED_CONTAM: hypothetical protein HDU68_005679, partial [Siphonaria sp. JEL0065]